MDGLNKKEYTLVMETDALGFVESESLLECDPGDGGKNREEFWCRAKVRDEDLDDASVLGFVFDPVDYVDVLNRGIELGRQGYDIAVIANVIKGGKASVHHGSGAGHD